MADFIQKMNWNYVSVVYSDNAYGIKGYQGNVTSYLSYQNQLLCETRDM